MTISDERLRWLSSPTYIGSEPGQIAAELYALRAALRKIIREATIYACHHQLEDCAQRMFDIAEGALTPPETAVSTLCAVCDQIKELHPNTHPWTAKEMPTTNLGSVGSTLETPENGWTCKCGIVVRKGFHCVSCGQGPPAETGTEPLSSCMCRDAFGRHLPACPVGRAIAADGMKETPAERKCAQCVYDVRNPDICERCGTPRKIKGDAT